MISEVQDQVEFVVNASYPQVLNWLSRASIGLSTMVDEHFGINVVEFMVRGAAAPPTPDSLLTVCFSFAGSGGYPRSSRFWRTVVGHHRPS